jgi:sugar lactone lactonase YvrE
MVTTGSESIWHGLGHGVRRAICMLGLLALGLGLACGGSAPAPDAGRVSPDSVREAAPTEPARAGSFMPPTVAPATDRSPGPTPTPAPLSGVSVIGYGAGAPDDLAIDASGTVLFSDQGNSAINELSGDGRMRVVARGFRVPEGVVLLPDGRVILAEQSTNRLWLVDRSDGNVQLLAQIPNYSGKAGIDGLGYDGVRGHVLVPDSANGRLLRLDPSTGRWREIARGFVRPTGAAVGANGDIYVADEFGQGVYRVDSSGRASLVAPVTGVDDVAVTRDGLLIMALLSGRLLRLEADGSITQLASVDGPIHGVAVDRDNSIVFSDMRGNRILRWRP